MPDDGHGGSVKDLGTIKRDFQEASHMKGPERLAATRKCQRDLREYETALCRDPQLGTYFDVLNMKELIGMVQNSLNRMETAQQRAAFRKAAAA